MPSKTPEQKKFMQAVAHSPTFAKKVGVPQSVGKDFSTADKNRKFSKGGDTMANTSRMNRLEELGRVNAEKASTAKGKRNLSAEKSRIVKDLEKHKSMPASKAHKGLKMGGSVAPSKMGKVKTNSRPDGVAERGLTKAKKPVMKTMARGGKTC
jgi:hypothetical protein